MSINVLPSDRFAVAGAIDPDAYPAATYETGWIDMADFHNILAMVAAGTLGANATVDARIEQATDAAGTGVKDVEGKAITQMTQAGGNSDQQAIINCRAEELDIANGFTHARLSVTIATAPSDLAAIVFGLDARYQPAEQASTVGEVVA